ncbi:MULTISPECIES: VOC family protein [unclassified Bradyrhizobium]|uniref:VOC family protein n=1 Tax=Bradyrhizobium TaxID=374 RepID=UPI002916A05F|nr:MULTISPECIES: VOC family protein [unclassified Bradyrhizobium]
MAALVRPRGLGEVVLRVRDIPRAISFYRDILGLEVLRTFEDRIAFLKIETGFEGHERIVGLFRVDQPSNRAGTTWSESDIHAPTLHHFALEIPLLEYSKALDALTSAGFSPNTYEHRWIGWRSIYITDPDGNIVELVAVDQSIRT